MSARKTLLILLTLLGSLPAWGAMCGPVRPFDSDGGEVVFLPGTKEAPPVGPQAEPPQFGPETYPEPTLTVEVPAGNEPSISEPNGPEPTPEPTGPEPEREPSTHVDASPDQEAGPEPVVPEEPTSSNETAPLQSWIGEPCTSDRDCTFQGGRCLLPASGYPQGHCTKDCTRTCPDQAGKPVTFCIQASPSQGQCVSQCNSSLYPQNGCRPNYACRSQSRFNETTTQKDVCVPFISSQNKGTLVARMYITYYYLSEETNYTGTANTTLYDSQCKALVTVPAKFSDSVCIEGSGKLKDGRIINYAKSCTCGRRCPTGGIVCYSILDKSRYPWGAGAASRSLHPLRSLAVDRSIIPIGTRLYIPEWDGVTIPKIGSLGGFKHDGCLVADDVGGGIKGNHFDFFAATNSMWKALEKIHPTRTYLTVYKNPGRCP